MIAIKLFSCGGMIVHFSHVLIFGGTGMLAQATGWVAERSDFTVAFGRNRQRLDRLEKRSAKYGLRIQELDYTDTEALKNAVATAYTKYGEIDMVVAWIHGTAPNAISTIKQQIAMLQKTHRWLLIIIKGSSSNLSSIIATEATIPENCTVKEVQLGFIFNGTTSRWLTHEEISLGVIQAIKGNKSKVVVGTLEPWNKRP